MPHFGEDTARPFGYWHLKIPWWKSVDFQMNIAAWGEGWAGMTRRALPRVLPELRLDLKAKGTVNRQRGEAVRLYKGLDTRGQREKQVLIFQHDVRRTRSRLLSVNLWLSLALWDKHTHNTHSHTVPNSFLLCRTNTLHTHHVSAHWNHSLVQKALRWLVCVCVCLSIWQN